MLLLPRSQLCPSRQHHLPHCIRSSLSVTTPISHLSTRPTISPSSHGWTRQCSSRIVATVISDSKVPTTFTVDSAGGGIDVLPDSGGSDNNGGGAGGNGGGGSGDGGNDESGSSGSDDHEKKGAMSMSQKLTLGYAALIGTGGSMGYINGASQKSLIASVISASVLGYAALIGTGGSMGYIEGGSQKSLIAG